VTERSAAVWVHSGPMDLETLRADAEEIAGDVIALRRRVHAFPEVGRQLPGTQRTVLDALDGLGLETTTGGALSSVVAVLRGQRPGPTFLLRADMDALPVQERTDLEYASQIPGVMHACGHDGHTAMLLGAAKLLATRRARIAGQVVFMFQPAEESAEGAKAMIEDGVLDAAGPPVTGAFALHLTPNLPTGTFRLTSGPGAAAVDWFSITIRGRGGHGARPQTALDPIPPAAEVVQALYTHFSRRVSPFERAVLSVCSVQAGTAFNVIPDHAVIRGTVRTVDEPLRDELAAATERVARGVALAHQVIAEVEYEYSSPLLDNDPAVVERVREVATALYGPAAVTELDYPSMGGEDFAFVTREVPAAMANLGACPHGVDPVDAPGNHSARMTIDEAALVRGVAVCAGVALSHLAHQGETTG
jgi:amidohydrolase